MARWLPIVGFFVVLWVLAAAEPAMAGGGGGGGGVKAVSVPALSPLILGLVQVALAAGYLAWRRSR